MLPAGSIKEQVLAAHPWALAPVVRSLDNRKQVHEKLGDDLRRAVAVDYVAGINELLKLALGCAVVPEAVAQPATPPGRLF